MGRRRALIVANSEYDHSGLSALRSPAADAAALAEVLGDRRVSDFEVEVVRNETANVVQERIEDLFLEGEPDDVLLLHFSCHGVKSESGELYFAARNTRPHRLGSTAVPADFVRRCMRVSRSRSIVLLLDCCYGGAFSEGVSVRAAGDVAVLDSLAGGRGRAVITASNSMEYAFEGDQLAEEHAAPSVFTSALVRGLSTGEADRDEDGLISLNELYDYVFEQVRQNNPNQTPSRDIEMQGELYLARSGRRRIKPLPMPADLAAATSDPNMFTRLGAVAELRSRLRSPNLEVAAGAFEALTGMARTDIANVAAAASEALSDVAVRPSVEELRFSEASPQVVSLSGPPLARACSVAASEAWIVVAEAGDGWSVSVRRVPPGVSHGRVVFTGPTGDASVAVIAVETPVPEPARADVPQVPEQRPEAVGLSAPEHLTGELTEPRTEAGIPPTARVPHAGGSPTARPRQNLAGTPPQQQRRQPASEAQGAQRPVDGPPATAPPPDHSAAPQPPRDAPQSAVPGRSQAAVSQPVRETPHSPAHGQSHSAAPQPLRETSRPSARPDQLVRRCATLSLIAGALLLVTQLAPYTYGDPLFVTSPVVLWYFTPMAVAALLAGGCLLAGARAAGLGVLVATATVSSWGWGVVIGELATGGFAPYNVGFWAAPLGWAGLCVAAGVAGVVVRRDAQLTFSGGRVDWRGAALMACGVAVAVLFLVLMGQVVASASTVVAAESLPSLVLVLPPVLLALTTPVTPVLAARARPHGFAMALVVTWAVLLASTAALYHFSFVSLAWLVWVPLALSAAAAVRPR
ncbi:caspase, EACC1-associated type [Lentzea tibetensis]|uniref:caspase, EACC1-associated type n=1 Tax=Lentzea tibetensis TaxID=2591470 RepID=UPI001F38A997|nr:caspase family protein [Lentzea tibetensis]